MESVAHGIRRACKHAHAFFFWDDRQNRQMMMLTFHVGVPYHPIVAVDSSGVRSDLFRFGMIVSQEPKTSQLLERSVECGRQSSFREVWSLASLLHSTYVKRGPTGIGTCKSWR